MIIKIPTAIPPLVVQSGLAVEAAVQENGTSGPGESTDSFEDVDPAMVSISPVSDGGRAVPEVADIVGTAEQTAADYEEEFAENEMNYTGFSWGGMGSMLKQYRIQSQYRDEIKDLKISTYSHLLSLQDISTWIP